MSSFATVFPSVSADAEVGRINPTDRELEEQTIVCPKLIFGDTAVERPTMSVVQCARRLLNDKECRNHCMVVDHVREKLKLPPGVPNHAAPRPRDGITCQQCGETYYKRPNRAPHGKQLCCICVMVYYRVPELQAVLKLKPKEKTALKTLSSIRYILRQRSDREDVRSALTD